MFKFFPIVLLVVLVGCQSKPKMRGAESASTVELQLLAINDFHGNLEPNTIEPEPGMALGKALVPAGGVVRLASLVRERQRSAKHSLFLSVGDLIGASPLVSSLLQDEPTMEAMRAMGMRYSAVGNHEIDYGTTTLLRLQNGGCPEPTCLQNRPYTGAGLKFLAANIHAGPDAKAARVFPPYAIERIDGIPVAIIGVALSTTPDITLAENVAGWHFAPEVASANALIPELQAQGVRAIVALVHEGGFVKSDQDRQNCSDLTGPIKSITEQLDPEIDVVFSAHTHVNYICEVSGKLLVQGLSYGRVLTEVTLTLNRASGDVQSKRARNHVVYSELGKQDVEMQTLVTAAKQLTRVIAERVVATLPVPQVSKVEDESGESALGRLMADAQLAGTSNPEHGKAQIALMNDGGVRNNLPIMARPGNVLQYGDIYATHPFGNEIVVVELSGSELKAVLEQQFIAEDRLIGSMNLRYSFNVNGALGERVLAESIMVDGQVVKPDARIRVAVNSYIQGGGSGQSILKAARVLGHSKLDRELLIDYLQTKPKAETWEKPRSKRLTMVLSIRG